MICLPTPDSHNSSPTPPHQRVAKFEEAQSQAQAAQAQAKTKAQSAASAPTQAPQPRPQAPTASTQLPSKPTSEQSSRDQIFPLLVSELVSERILSATDGSKLRRLYAQEHPVINAAMDVYDVDGDIAELVDTLQRCVLTSQ